jgi:hypothetical protein
VVVLELRVVRVHLSERWESLHHRGRLHARRRLQAIDQVVEERYAPRLLGIFRCRKHQPERRQIAAVEAGVEPHQPPEAAQHESRADHEHHRERDLGYHQPTSHSIPRYRCRASRAAFLQRETHRTLADVEKRCQTEHHAREQGRQDREYHDPGVETDVRRTRQAVRVRGDEGLQAAIRQPESGGAPEHGERHPFGHELTQQPRASGAKGRPDREFAVSRLGPGQQQVRHVRARDQQHEADRYLQHPQRTPDVADDIAVQRRVLQSVVDGMRNVRVRGHLAPLRQQRVQLRVGLSDAHARLHAADQVEEVAAPVLSVRRIQAHRQPHLGR